MRLGAPKAMIAPKILSHRCVRAFGEPKINERPAKMSPKIESAGKILVRSVD
jgi:hypothetical protein